MKRIAVIGAGMAGLTVARQLHDEADVTVFEKSSAPGGRMATRRAEPFAFDHGAQHFRAKTPEFQSLLDELKTAGVITSWNAPFVVFDRSEISSRREWGEDLPHYVGVPGMNAIGRHMADGLNVEYGVQVHRIERVGSGWQLETDGQPQPSTFDWVICTAPAEQTLSLMPTAFAHRDAIADIRMQGCFALMLGFSEPLELSWRIGLVRGADISWVAVNSSKPGRDSGFSVLVHASNAFADEHLDWNLEKLKQHLSAELLAVTGIDSELSVHSDIHRWRYANIPQQSGPAAFVDSEQGLAACGDWCIRGRVESAYLSAIDAARQVGSHIL